MRRYLKTCLTTALLIGALLPCSPAMAEEIPLTGAEITALLSGKTFTGNAGQIHFKKTYNADQTYSLIIEDDPARLGTWRVEGNSYCQRRDEEEECFTVKKAGDLYKMYSGDELHTSFKQQ